MLLRKREIQNYEPAEVEQHIRAALELVERLSPADDLRPHVFAQAVNLYSGKQIMVEQVQTGSNGLALPHLGG